jgi:uncharacterized protein YbcI
MDQTQQTAEVSSYIGKLLRNHFGRGPDSVFVSIGYPFISMYLRNFISPMEKVLIRQKQDKIVQQTREILIQTLIPEIKAYIKIITGMEIREFYYDWGLHNNSGLFLGIASDSSSTEETLIEDYPGREHLHQEIVHLSRQAEKAPAELYSCQLNSRTVVAVRNGILVSIEKQLIREGHQEILKIAKRTLEKGLLHNNGRFEGILNSKIVDIFVDWDFDLDKSVFVFILNPTV